MEEMPSVVFAGCVLHNFCLLADEGDIEQFFDDDSDGDDSDSDFFKFLLIINNTYIYEYTTLTSTYK